MNATQIQATDALLASFPFLTKNTAGSKHAFLKHFDGFLPLTAIFNAMIVSHAHMTVPHLQLTVAHAHMTVPHGQMTVSHEQMTVAHAQLTVPHLQLTVAHSHLTVPFLKLTVALLRLNVSLAHMMVPFLMMAYAFLRWWAASAAFALSPLRFFTKPIII